MRRSKIFFQAWVGILVFVLLSLTGCAFQRALDRGHDYVAAKDYRSALAAYEQALALDDDEQAERLVAQLRPYAVDQAEEEAREAIAQGRYEAAAEDARYVQRLDEEAGEALFEQIGRWMLASVDGSMLEHKMETAYPLAVRARRLFPKMEALEGRFARLRAHFHDRSERALAAEDFPGALAALDVIEQHEPARASALAPRRQEIRGAWADQLVSRGEVASKEGHLGVAAVLYARAFEVATRSADADRMRAELSQLEREGRFSLLLREEGDGARPRIRERVTAGARALDGVRVVDADAASMLVTIQAEPLTCSQRYDPRRGAQEYVAGTRMVDNPRYLKLGADIRATSGRLDRAAGNLARQLAESRQVQREARSCERTRRGPAAEAARQARSQVQTQKGAVEARRARVEQLRQEERVAQSPEERAEKEEALRAAERALAEAEQALGRAQQNLARAERELSQADGSCRRLSRRANDAAVEAAAATAEIATLERDLERLEREQLRTPRQVSEDIIEVFRYEIRRFTRTCAGSVTVDLEPAWKRGGRRQLESARHTQDDSHPAHSRYGVRADPLRFPLTDDDLRAGADQDVANQIISAVADFVRDYYASMTKRAGEIAGSDPDTATDMMVALLVAAPEQLSTEHRSRIAARLRDRYGLADVATLRR